MVVFWRLLPQMAFVSLRMAEVRIKFAQVRVKSTGVRIKFAGHSKKLLRAGNLPGIKTRNQTKARACHSTILLLATIVACCTTTRPPWLQCYWSVRALVKRPVAFRLLALGKVNDGALETRAKPKLSIASLPAGSTAIGLSTIFAAV